MVKNTLTKKGNNIFSIQGKGLPHYDKNQAGKTYATEFKTYSNLEESLEDWAKLVLNPQSTRYSPSYNAAKISPEQFAKVHAWSGYAEGIGNTKEEAKSKLEKSYLDSYNTIIKLRNQYNI